jgi:hypothetical protein
LNNKVVLHFGAKASVAKTAFHTHPVTTSIFIPEFPKKTQKNKVFLLRPSAIDPSF